MMLMYFIFYYYKSKAVLLRVNYFSKFVEEKQLEKEATNIMSLLLLSLILLSTKFQSI